MKNLIASLYNINVTAFLKITPKVYRLKATGADYCLKYIENNNCESTFARLAISNCNLFAIPIKSLYGSYICQSKDGYYFYMMPWYSDEINLSKDVKLRFYLSSLAKLHQTSVYQTRVNKGYFEDAYEYIEKLLDEAKSDIDSMIGSIEKMDYRSPVQWLYLINNQRFYQSIEKSRRCLEHFKSLVNEKNVIRVTLTYQNFDYSNIIVKEGKIIGPEKFTIAPPLFDLKDIFDKSFESSIDITTFLDEYLKNFKLLDYEKEWLLALISLPVFDFRGNGEVEKIVNLTRTIYHLQCAEEVENILESHIKKEPRNESY